MCLLLRIDNFQKVAVVPSRNLEISVVGKRVQVRTESIQVKHQVRQPERAEFARGWPAYSALANILETQEQGKGDLSGI